MALSGSIKTNNYDGRYYTLSWTATQSIATNESVISWTISCAGGDDTWYAERTLKAVINGTSVYSKTSRVERKKGTIKTGTITIPHNTDGTKTFSCSIKVAVYTSNVNLTQSGSFELDAIPRQATLIAAPNFTDEDNPTISYSNPAGEAVTNLWACISLTGEVDNVTYRDIPKTGSTYEFQLTDAERSMLQYNTNSGSNARTVYFIVATELDGVVYKSTLAKTLTIANCTPMIAPYIKDVGAASLLLTGNENTIIKGFNYVSASMGNALYKGATIVSQTITNGSNQLVGETGGAATMEGGFNNTENPTFVFSLTDSRGLTASQTITIPMIEYVKLTCDLVAEAPTTAGVMSITVSGNCYNGSFGAVDNYLAIDYRIKANNEDWGAWHLIQDAYTINNNKYSVKTEITGLNYLNTYTVQVRTQDRCLLVESATKKVKTMPLFDWGEDDFNFNVSSITIKNTPLFDMVRDVCYPPGSIIYTTNPTNPSEYIGGYWTQIKDVFLLAAGDTFGAGTLGGEPTHILTVDEMPNINGKIQFRALRDGTAAANVLDSGNALTFIKDGGNNWSYGMNYTSGVDMATDVIALNVGGGLAHNNMPPYRAVYVWERQS